MSTDSAFASVIETTPDTARRAAWTRRLRPGFPERVDEVNARLTAAGVVVMASATTLGARWVVVPLVIGFVLRAVWGPKASPLARFVSQRVRPRVNAAPRLVSGAPKRFAQMVGVAFSGVALAAFLSGAQTFGVVMVAGLAGAAFLEAAFGLCLGCKVYAAAVRAGWISDDACPECADISSRLGI